MKKSEFIYQFSKIYFKEAVNETILIENWEEGDFDSRYVEYAKVFLDLSKCFEENVNYTEIFNQLSKNKINLVNAFNEKIYGYFVEELKKHTKKAGSPQEIIKKNIPMGDSINPDILKIFRDLEERLYYN